jgi:hypothetical protein
MEMDSLTVANTGNITANGGTVTLNAATINGGTLTQTGGGMLQTITGGQATLNGVTLSSGSTYSSGNNSVTIVSGTITNNGTFQITSAANNSFLNLSNNTTLTGGGTITLNQGGAGFPIIEQQVGGLTLTNSNNLIQGAGIIGNGGLTVINNGTITANQSGATLLLNGSGGVTNTNLIEATGGGLQISTVINDAGGNITPANGSSVLLNSTIQGGTLNTLGHGNDGNECQFRRRSGWEYAGPAYDFYGKHQGQTVRAKAELEAALPKKPSEEVRKGIETTLVKIGGSR